jgi:ABC-type branched-subunit amino acid transport system permease subunit
VIILADWTGRESLGKFGGDAVVSRFSSQRSQRIALTLSYLYRGVPALSVLQLLLLSGCLMAGVGGLLLVWLSTSRIGKILEAIRENEDAVEAAGINVAEI